MNQRILVVFAVAISCWAPGEPAAGQERQQPEPRLLRNASGTNGDGEDLNAIRRGSQTFVDAFNRGDAKAVAMLWVEDGDYIDDAGRKFRGRAAIENEYANFFDEHRGVKIRIVIESLRLIGGGAAVEDGRAILEPAPEGAPATTKYTAVHVKDGGKWLMSTVRDMRLERPSGYGNVADLEWLIGTWTAEEHGVKSESVCRWVANKSFVERSYTTTQPDGTVTSGVQIIGWNPERGQVQSWNFGADGGHAVGRWTPRERGWAAEVRGVTVDGNVTAAVNLLTKLDENAYSWQSVQRSVAGQSLPDSDEIVLKRKPQE